jgi:hypothetical protein
MSAGRVSAIPGLYFLANGGPVKWEASSTTKDRDHAGGLDHRTGSRTRNRLAFAYTASTAPVPPLAESAPGRKVTMARKAAKSTVGRVLAERRRSNAAGLHVHKIPRNIAKRAAIKDQRD